MPLAIRVATFLGREVGSQEYFRMKVCCTKILFKLFSKLICIIINYLLIIITFCFEKLVCGFRAGEDIDLTNQVIGILFLQNSKQGKLLLLLFHQHPSALIWGLP